MHKTVALVLALTKLDYYSEYCIDADKRPFCDTAFSTAADEWQNEASGVVPLVETQKHSKFGTSAVTPRQLLHGGHHFDEIGLSGRYNRQRRYNYISKTAGVLLL